MHSIDAWFMFGFGVLLAVLGAIGAARSAQGVIRQRRVLRRGHRVQGEIVRVDQRVVSYYGLYRVAPVARYSVDGQQHEARVVNRTGRVDVGAGIDLAVDPADAWSPYAVAGSYLPTSLAVSLAYVALGVAAAGWALSW